MSKQVWTSGVGFASSGSETHMVSRTGRSWLRARVRLGEILGPATQQGVVSPSPPTTSTTSSRIQTPTTSTRIRTRARASQRLRFGIECALQIEGVLKTFPSAIEQTNKSELVRKSYIQSGHRKKTRVSSTYTRLAICPFIRAPTSLSC